MKKLAWMLAVLAVPATAMGQEARGARAAAAAAPWSVTSARLVPSGQSALHAQIGWPGLSATFRHGASSRFDVGARFSFNYGFENIAFVLPGFKLQAVTRLQLVESDRFNFGLMFDPGMFFYFQPQTTVIGLTLPVKFAMGIPVGSALMLNLGMDVPFLIQFTPSTAASMQLLFGGGLEYALDRNLLLTFNARFGPAIPFAFAGAQLAFELLMGVAFKL